MLVNGTCVDAEPKLVEALIDQLKLDKNRIVVEVNGTIVAPDQFGTFWLAGDEIVEIVSFVGGG